MNQLRPAVKGCKFNEDQMVEDLREHFIDKAPTPRFLVVLTGPSETLYGHTIAGFGLRMGFLEARGTYYDKAGNTGMQYKLTTKGENILSIGTMLKTGDWPEEGRSEPPKRIINVRRLA